MKIAIVGCGIGGLSAANLLADSGHDVLIYDQFTVPAPVGSGLVIQPVGLEVLKNLGLADDAVQIGAPGYQMLGLEARSGRKVLDVSYGKQGGDIFGLGIHRASIFNLLLRAVQQRNVEIRLESKVIHSTVADGLRYLELKSGIKEGPFDLVIDASGVQSKLSTLRAKELPFGAIWGTVDWPENTTLRYNQLEQRYFKASNMIGILPVGSLPNENNKKATLFWSLPIDGYDIWRNTDIGNWHAEAEVLWPELAPFVRQITDHQQMTMARYSHGQLFKPYAERLVFIGDSAHRASPQLGQGANMALLDAYALACALEQYPLEEAFPAYTKARRNHVMIYQAMSWAFTPMYQSHSKLLPLLRDLVLAPMSRLSPVSSLLTRLVRGSLIDSCRGLRSDN